LAIACGGLISSRTASRIAAMNAAPKTEDGVLIGLLPIFLPALIGMREWKHGGNRVEQVTETTDFLVATAKQESADGMTLVDSCAKLSSVMSVGGSNPSGRAMSSRKNIFTSK
jgi:hypothetical protein